MSHPSANKLERGLLSVLALTVAVGFTATSAQAQGMPADVRKSAIEVPLKKIISDSRTKPVPLIPSAYIRGADLGKMGVESPLKSLIRGGSRPSISSLGAAGGSAVSTAKNGSMALSGGSLKFFRSSKTRKDSFPRPDAANESTTKSATRLKEIEDERLPVDKVKPGRVAWHDSFQKAMAASARSGKPVFLFHMMGRLDDRFC